MLSDDLPIEISAHARQQMHERGATESEVISAVREGEQEPARKNRTLFRKNFQFERMWQGQWYRIKQVAPIVAHEPDKLVVVTVFSFYF